MKKQLFGLQRNQINKLFKEWQINQDSELAEMRLDVERMKAKNKQLELEIRNKTAEMPKELLKEQRVWQFGAQRMDHLFTLLEKNEQVEMKELKKASDEKIHQLKKQISDVEVEILTIEQLLSETVAYLSKEVHPTLKDPLLHLQVDESLPSLVEVAASTMGASSVENETVAHPVEEGLVAVSETPIIEEVDMIKTQYIVGKLAGEDLYDWDGEILVHKNAEITLEVVNEVSRIGKLAELIIHMKLH